MKTLNDKAISLIQQAIEMTKKGEKKFTDIQNDVVIRIDNGDFAIRTKMNKILAVKKPVKYEQFFNLEPYSVIIIGRKSKKILFKGEWVNRIMTAKKVQLIRHK